MSEPGLARRQAAGPAAVFSWCLFDWANSAFPTVITTFVFAAYFTKAVAVDEVTGTSQWGYAISLSALLVAVVSPILGAVADHSGRRKPWLAGFTALAVTASGLLWFVHPDPAFAMKALAGVALASFAFETGMVFYNAMLPDLAPHERIGRVSGWGWGLGYAGGLACLAATLVGFVETDDPWFGLDREEAEHLRAVGPFVAAWFALFALPLFLVTPDAPATGRGIGRAVKSGLAELARTCREVRRYAHIVRFLVARMIYTDGLNTLFAFGGIYAAGTFGMDFPELIRFGIVMNVTAGLGAALFAWVDDWIGPKRTILISLGALTVLGGIIVLIDSKTQFWIFGPMLGLFVGPAQAASRSMMAHMAPAGMRTAMFGLYALSGKATAFLGPALLGWVTALAGSQRWGMATILVFFLLGMAVLVTVPPVHARRAR